MNEVIRQDLGDGIVVARLNRPEKLNAINLAWIEAFGKLLDELDRDDSRVLIITGEGRGFCAGADLNSDFTTPGTTESSYENQLALARIVERLTTLRQPVIAAVNGAAAGGGFALALASEIRIAGRSASFHISNARMGLSAGESGIAWMLPRAIGLSRSFELMLTGRKFDAEEADRIGFVSRIVEDIELMDCAVELARQIVALPPFSVWMTKDVVRKGLEMPSLSTAIGLEARTQLLCGSTGGFKEATAAFFEKRPAKYS